MPIYGHRHSHHACSSSQPAIDQAPRVPANITQSRINNFMSDGGQFYGMGIQRVFWTTRCTGQPHVQLRVYSVPDLKEAVSQTFTDYTLGQHEFGPSWSTHWFYLVVTIPEEMKGEEVVLLWDMGCEGLVWSMEGEPLQGLTGGSDQSRHEYIITEKARTGQKFEFYIEAACNGMFGVGANDAMVADPNRYFCLRTADIAVRNKAIQGLFHDLSVIRGIALDTDKESARARQALWTVNEVVNNFIADDPKAIDSCSQLTKQFLGQANGSGQHKVTAVGNCHIDTAWLWPYDETKRKIARSWSSQLELINRYPDYVFTGSQVQQYEWLKDLYPTLFKDIQKAEKRGRWEIIGGSWVEHGIFIPCMISNQFFIGYSGQLPQVLRESGCDYFFTQKLSWNNINKFPLTTFWWVGIDDSRILAHLTPAETYTAAATVSDLNRCVKNHHDIENSNESLLVYGHGDGGGGPTPEMLERLNRMKNVNGLPSVQFGSATQFFEGIEKYSERLQSYKGELYLEFHRGTYTTQALVKQGNRKGEVNIRDAELLATMAKVYSKTDIHSYSYPYEEITRLWKLLCLNQFHDCLPGSAINLAFIDVHKFHREVISKCLTLRHDAQSSLINEVVQEKVEGHNKQGIIVFNTLPWCRSEVIRCLVKDTKWNNQQWNKSGYEYLLVNDVPGLGVSGYVPSTSDVVKVEKKDSATAYETKAGEFVLENKKLKATFNVDGQLIELIDKESNRGNLVPEKCQGNVLQLYEDVPTYWDAWDIEIYHLQKYVELQGQKKLKIVSEGPLKAELCFTHKISDVSTIEQIISLTCIGKWIEFDSTVQWHESHQCLKVEFSWDIISDYATYDIQYGVIRRPNHYNTTIDSAKFEVCGHKFADLSESNYGVALMNDCKYGYATHGSTQRLTLLRSPKGPDEHADMGQHQFKYAVYPHSNNYALSDVMQSALEFNTPVSIRHAVNSEAKSGVILSSLFEVIPSTNIIIDTVKLAEDDNDKGKHIIIRLYEAYGGKCKAQLKSPLNIKKILISNILEDDTSEEIRKNDLYYPITLRPFQIMTLKVFLH
ncbi:galactose mutarotase-like domain-containing protein [Pilobolus umbonatus]|nr:galactose mutarotase-like domain-containing protein [Pilobolus umbonatus]